MWLFNFQLIFLKPRLPFMARAKAKFIQVLSSHNIPTRYGTPKWSVAILALKQETYRWYKKNLPPIQNFWCSPIGKDVKQAIAFCDSRVRRDHHEPAGMC